MTALHKRLGVALSLFAVAKAAIAMPIDLRCLHVIGAELVSDPVENPSDRDPAAMDWSRFGADNLRLANNGHTVRAGKNDVVLIRWYDKAEGRVDADLYKKISFSMPTNVPNSDQAMAYAVMLHYSAGASSWVSLGAFSYFAGSVPFEIKREGDAVKLRMRGSIVAQRADQGGEAKESIDLECSLTLKPIDQLTDWEGRPHETSYRTFRP